MNLFDGSVGFGTGMLLLLCLGIAFAFEFVNGFHDTANAVATVIYTRSLRPWVAVIWSGIMNFLGVLLGGTAVAFSIVHLLPTTLLMNLGATTGILMILSLLISAMIWNLGTWYFGIPSSSSHTLIGSIFGVGLISSLFSGNGIGSGVNWTKAYEITLSLLISPLIGFTSAGLLLLVAKYTIRNKKLYEEPDKESPPPLWIRAILWLTCTGVSFAHGSNDGQKGMGLVMLILIAIVPAQYALNPSLTPAHLTKSITSVEHLERITNLYPARLGEKAESLHASLATLRSQLQTSQNLPTISGDSRIILRRDLNTVDELLAKFEKAKTPPLSALDKAEFASSRKQLKGMVDYVATWVLIAVAMALGIGTMIGWKRVVKTIGEKIGQTHMTYAQGASAELVAAIMISVAAGLGLPVSTTHVLSSGVAGTMTASGSKLQAKTVRNILLAWVLTLPVTICLSGLLFYMTTGGSLKANSLPPVNQGTTQSIQKK